MKLVSFWKVLSDEKIQIPLSQRDYAQGRADKEALRTKFVTRLLDALRRPETESVKLDFVFGVKDGFLAFQPLDGQQRLTTLWLLHWYVAQRAGVAMDVRKVLSRFSYETRDSSTSFCQALALSDGWNGVHVEHFIKSQRWYFDRYELDPSVRGFVRTLVTIEQSVSNDEDFVLLWSRLTAAAGCPIQFFVRDDMPANVADDLYIKMNSRGKGLTEFENFKADLMGTELPGFAQDRLFTMEEAALVDNAWTDLFWAHQEDGEIDDIYFQFFKRYLLAWRIAETGHSGRQQYETVDNVLKEDLYVHLHEGREYVSIAPYAVVLVPEMKNDLKSFFKAFATCKQLMTEPVIDRIVAPYWLGEDEPPPYTLIPRYGLRGDMSVVLDQKLGQGLPVLYAACRFLEKNLVRLEGADPTDFKMHFAHWMRFVWNLTESSFISTDAEMVSSVRLLREVSDRHTWDIDDYLAGQDVAALGRDSAREKSYVAEVQKARLRKHERDCLRAGVETFAWASWIARAEEVGFVHGEIEFLLPDATVEDYLKGNADGHDFEIQVTHMESCFGNDGILQDVRIPLVKAVMKGLARFWPTHETCGFYDNEFLCRTDKEAWRETIFRDPVMARAVANALAADDLAAVQTVPFSDVGGDGTGQTAQDQLRNDLLDSGILDDVGLGMVGPTNKCSWRFRAYATMSFYRKTGAGKNSSPRYYFDTRPFDWVQGCKRSEFLLSGAPIEVYERDVILGYDVCVPEDRYNTYFTFTDETLSQTRKFSWHLDNIIRLLDDDWHVIQGRHFLFDYNMTRDDFIHRLSNLIANA